MVQVLYIKPNKHRLDKGDLYRATSYADVGSIRNDGTRVSKFERAVVYVADPDLVYTLWRRKWISDVLREAFDRAEILFCEAGFRRFRTSLTGSSPYHFLEREGITEATQYRWNRLAKRIDPRTRKILYCLCEHQFKTLHEFGAAYSGAKNRRKAESIARDIIRNALLDIAAAFGLIRRESNGIRADRETCG